MMGRTFVPLSPATPVAFTPTDTAAPSGAEAAMSHMYREVGTNRIWAFLLIGTMLRSLVACGDSELGSIAWLRGAIRGINMLAGDLAYAGLLWLSPDDYYARGGKFGLGGKFDEPSPPV